MFGINACNVDTITVMSNAVNDCICQRTIITTQLVVPFLELIVQIPLVSIEAIRPKSGQRDWHT